MTKTATEILTFDGVVLVHVIIQSQLRNKIDLKKGYRDTKSCFQTSEGSGNDLDLEHFACS